MPGRPNSDATARPTNPLIVARASSRRTWLAPDLTPSRTNFAHQRGWSPPSATRASFGPFSSAYSTSTITSSAFEPESRPVGRVRAAEDDL